MKPIGYNERRMRRDYVKIRAAVCVRVCVRARARTRVYDYFAAIFFQGRCCDIANFIDTVKCIHARLKAQRYAID